MAGMALCSARFLVDTDVLSAGAPSKAQPIPELIEWMDRNSENLYVSVVTIAEIEDGIAKSGREGARRKLRAFGNGWRR
jgi:predicted nucleic acid-binding protein